MPRVISSNSGSDFHLRFDDGSTLTSHHDSDCCEQHYLSAENLTLADFEGLEFDLSGEKFFERVDGYGIRLVPLSGHPVSVPGYCSNNGYYSTQLALVLRRGSGERVEYDISECQELNFY